MTGELHALVKRGALGQRADVTVKPLKFGDIHPKSQFAMEADAMRTWVRPSCKHGLVEDPIVIDPTVINYQSISCLEMFCHLGGTIIGPPGGRAEPHFVQFTRLGPRPEAGSDTAQLWVSTNSSSESLHPVIQLRDQHDVH